MITAAASSSAHTALSDAGGGLAIDGKHSCPGCSKVFPTWRGAATHLGGSQACKEKHKEAGKQVQANAKARRVVPIDTGLAKFREERTHVVANCLADLRDESEMSDMQVDRVKHKIASMLQVCEKELVRRLELLTPSLKSTVHEVLDIFNGLENKRQELSYLKGGCQFIEPVEHIFGTSLAHTTDAEGFTYSKKKVTHRGHYIPMARTIERLLQEDPRAMEMVLASQRKWFMTPPRKGTAQKIYLDVDDGLLFDEHPELGAAQRGTGANGKIRLCIIMYYDGLEVGCPAPRTLSPPHSHTHTAVHV